MVAVFHVFDSLDVLTPYDALAAGQTGPHSAADSGAPYLLAPTTRCRTFDSTFDSRRRASVASDAAKPSAPPDPLLGTTCCTEQRLTSNITQSLTAEHGRT
ncbi:hypothetical protein ACFQ9Q_09625 [Streptomyces virginiae]|uniref:hypothetical protein n=1 Tax=Streptomyces virginiae TaxID=1961 RepID=UPI0036B5CD7A